MLEFNGNQCICGTVKVGERGQVVIPKKAREYFDINPGDSLVVVGDKNKGITLFKASNLKEFANMLLNSIEEDENR